MNAKKGNITMCVDDQCIDYYICLSDPIYIDAWNCWKQWQFICYDGKLIEIDCFNIRDDKPCCQL